LCIQVLQGSGVKPLQFGFIHVLSVISQQLSVSSLQLAACYHAVVRICQ
jgi:hypothetical protein